MGWVSDSSVHQILECFQVRLGLLVRYLNFSNINIFNKDKNIYLKPTWHLESLKDHIVEQHNQLKQDTLFVHLFRHLLSWLLPMLLLFLSYILLSVKYGLEQEKYLLL